MHDAAHMQKKRLLTRECVKGLFYSREEKGQTGMGMIELFILAVGLAMDAFAVAICKGLAMERATLKSAAVVGLYFGVFQAGMPVIGYLIGAQFKDAIAMVDHWIAFVLLAFLGGKMIKEALSHKQEEACDVCSGPPRLGPKEMLPLAVATSIDALAVGVSLAFLQANLVQAASFIGVITFFLSMLGVKIGNVFGARFQAKAELCGGVILIGMGIKILLEHLDVF